MLRSISSFLPFPAVRRGTHVDIGVCESPHAVFGSIEVAEELLERGGGGEDGVEWESGVAVLVVV